MDMDKSQYSVLINIYHKVINCRNEVLTYDGSFSISVSVKLRQCCLMFDFIFMGSCYSKC